MKRGWKIFWIVCGACAGIGIILCTIAFAVLGVSIEAIEERYPNGFAFPPVHVGNFHADDYDGRTDIAVAEGDDSQRYESVRSIDMYVCGGHVEVKTAEKGDTDVTVRTEDIDERLKLRYYMDGDTLTIRTKKSISGINNAGGVGKIYIYVPEEYILDEAELDVGAGTLFVENIHANELTVDVGAGEASVEQFTADEVDLNCGTGELTAVGNLQRDADIECGIGHINFTVNGQESDYNYDIECGIGQVVCGDGSYSGIGAGKEIDNGAAKEMDIECGIGQVTVNFM